MWGSRVSLVASRAVRGVAGGCVDCRYKRQFLVKPAQLKRVGLYDRDAIAALHFDAEGLGAGDLHLPNGSCATATAG